MRKLLPDAAPEMDGQMWLLHNTHTHKFMGNPLAEPQLLHLFPHERHLGGVHGGDVVSRPERGADHLGRVAARRRRRGGHDGSSAGPSDRLLFSGDGGGMLKGSTCARSLPRGCCDGARGHWEVGGVRVRPDKCHVPKWCAAGGPPTG
jgi:hypothetical protein